MGKSFLVTVAASILLPAIIAGSLLWANIVKKRKILRQIDSSPYMMKKNKNDFTGASSNGRTHGSGP